MVKEVLPRHQGELDFVASKKRKFLAHSGSPSSAKSRVGWLPDMKHRRSPESATTDDLRAAMAADKIAALKLCPVSDEIEERLDRYVAVLLEWQARTNLVAPSTLPQIWTRHIADSLQLLALAPGGGHWADLGSGGGFPGVVLACALVDKPGSVVHLIERNGKKAAFLREAVRITAAVGVVHLAEIGRNVKEITGAVDYVTARALAPLHQLLAFAEPLLRSGTRALFMKGQDVGAELEEANRYWKIQSKLHQSLTGNGWIVEVAAIERQS